MPLLHTRKYPQAALRWYAEKVWIFTPTLRLGTAGVLAELERDYRHPKISYPRWKRRNIPSSPLSLTS
jgi:hypothetical protein